MSYIYHPEAEADLLESVQFYEFRKPGLGASFFLEFEMLMMQVCEKPMQFPSVRPPDIRRANLPRFPFWIIFKTNDSKTEVLAVAHYRRHPDYWLERLGE